jgi:hypothetical protein
MNKNEEKWFYGIIFAVSVLIVFWKLDALLTFLTNAFLCALGVVVGYFSGKKWLELMK